MAIINSKVILFFCAYLFLLLFSKTGNAQNNQINDTARCRKLTEQIEAEQNHIIWIKYNQQLKNIAEQNLNSVGIDRKIKSIFIKYLSTSYNNYGAYYIYSDNYDSAILSYKKSYTLAKKINFHTGSALALQNIGTAYDFLGKLDSALIYFKLAYNEAVLSKDLSNIAYVKTDLGYVYNNLGDNAIAMKYNLEALKLFEKLKDNTGIERTCFSIGRIFDAQKDYQSALKFYIECLEINRLINDNVRIILSLNSIANCNINLKNNAFVKKYLDEAIQIGESNHLLSAIANSYKLYADYYYSINLLDSAQSYYIKSKDIFKTISSNSFYASTLTQTAMIDFKKMHYDKALKQAKEAYQISLESKYPIVTKNTSNLLSQIYLKLNDYKQAYFYKEIAANIADSIFYDESRNNTLKAEFKYQNEKSSNKIATLAQQKKIAILKNKQQKFLLFGLITLLFLSIILSYFIYNRLKIKKQNELLKLKLEELEKRSKIELQKNEAILTALKSQMNPHFIFNALNSIQELFMIGDKKIANEQMGNFAQLTRKILDLSGKQRIYLAEEIEILTMYLELESMRFENNFSYKIHLSETIDEDDIQLPPMLIQPYVENSMKHGLLHKNGQKKLDIYFQINEIETILTCIIDDNGIGRNASAEINKKRPKSHISFSTSATEKRLQLLNQGKQENIAVVFEDKVDENKNALGTKVSIQIPI
jgi:two-component system LytT family sensor kinase